MKRIILSKDEVLSNFLSCCAIVKREKTFFDPQFGFYFENEHMDVDMSDDYFGFDKIIEYIKNRSLDDLLYYYFINYGLRDYEYVYSKDSKYNNYDVGKVQLELFKTICPNDYYENESLIKIDPNWYKYIDSNVTPYGYTVRDNDGNIIFSF